MLIYIRIHAYLLFRCMFFIYYYFLFYLFILITGILNLIAEGKDLRDISFANLKEKGDFLPVSPSKLGENDPDMNDEEAEDLAAAVSMTASSSAISSMDV